MGEPPSQSELEARTKQLRRRIFQIERLAAMPQVVMQLVEALKDDLTPLDKLETIIESDPALASRVLSLANSAYYGFYQEITTIRRAVLAIGFEELRLLALGVGLAEFFNPNQIPKGLDGEQLWIHTLTVSWLAKDLAQRAGHSSPGEVMVGGLLHDLGKLVLATHFTREYAQVVREALRGPKPYYQVEEEFGLEHTLVGYWLAKRWNLPEVLAVAIRDHHTPPPYPAHGPSVALVILADAVSKSLGFGLNQESRPLDTGALLRLTKLSRPAIRESAVAAQKAMPDFLNCWRETIS
ncbi:MAG: HDOD domain-containing protein [Deltaproteobacteria bacterium]|nr:HDOD domain-containing protein [Deltaproteobacteria bacterium]